MMHCRTRLCAALLVCGAISGISACGRKPVATPRPNHSSGAHRLVAAGHVPLAFELNVGQVDRAVKFLTRGSGYQLFFTNDAATWVFRPSDGPSAANVLRMHVVGGNPDARVSGSGGQPGRTHYFRGADPSEWRTNVPTFARVHYSAVYPGIDLQYYGREGQLEYDFVVSPGVDPGLITVAFEGVDRMSKDGAGNLVLETPAGRLVQHRPLAYQVVDGVRQIVESRYVVTETNQIGFALGAYDPRQPLVIDPVISYSTYLGGTGGAYGDQAYGIAVDVNDNIYLTGKTVSASFPVQNSQPANNDVFVLKMTPAGALVYVVVVNGNGSDSGEGIAVDANGQVFVTGFTDSTNFPTLNPVHQDAIGRDAFAFKLDASGVIAYSTYLGGDDSFDYGEAVAIDASGNAYVTGTTKSANFPVFNALQPVIRGQDAFAVKLDPDGNLLYGTFLGGSNAEAAESIAVDADGSFYVAGWTTSTNFPTAQSTVSKANGEDVFVSHFAPDGSAFIYSRYLGGNSHERPFALTPDGAGGVYVGGRTDSTNFPAMLPLHSDKPGTDAFLTRLGAGGVVSFSTYLGGNGWERILGLSVRDGLLFVTGQTFSTDFPIVDAVQPAKAGDTTTADAFVATVDVALSTLESSTYLGGTRNEEGRGVAALPGFNVFVAGWTESTDFPTVRAIQDFKSNGGNVFITRIAPVGVDAVSPGFILNTGGSAITISGQEFSAGATVLVGGAAATSVTVVDGSTITAAAPALAGTGRVDVVVTNPDGGSGTLYEGLLVLNSAAPVADAGPDQTVEATSPSSTQVILDGSASFDPDNEPMTFEWRDAVSNVIGSGPIATLTLPIGVHTITLIVSDGHSAPATDTVSVSVVDTTAPLVEVVNPNGSNKIFTGTPTFIEWTASDAGVGLASFDVYLSTNGGSSFNATPICANVPATERSCTWSSPAPTTSKARIRVTARDAAGNTASDVSNANFVIVSGSAFLKVTAPNTSANWGAGSTQQITWSHNLGTAADTRLELSLDGGATWSLIHPGVKNSSSSAGFYNWTIPNALTSTARVRASWVSGPVSDQSDVNFTIASPFIQLSAPVVSANWGYGTTRQQTWTTNLGPLDRVDVVLETDGGLTAPITLAAGVQASARSATFVTPTLTSPTASAQVRVVWTNPPSGFAADGASPGLFRVEPAFVTLTFPDGGNTWGVGTKKSITWSSNLGSLERVLVELSLDDGASYAVVVFASTPSDGIQAAVAQSTWVTAQGRIRITWIGSPVVSDASNGSFVVR